MKSKIVFCLVIGGLLLWGSPSKADRELGVLELVEGQGVEVCEACLKAHQAIYEVGSSGCERNYVSALGLTKPAWSKLNPLKHLALLKHIMLFVTATPSEKIEGTFYEADKFQPSIQWFLDHNALKFSIAEVDVDNDGAQEILARVRFGRCGDPGVDPVQYQALVVLQADRKTIDTIKSERLIQPELYTPGFIFNHIYDIFHYRGEVFLDKWVTFGPEADTLKIYRERDGKVTQVCAYRFDRFKEKMVGGMK